MLRPPRNPKKDRLVNWKLILQAYGFIGVIETVASFAMSYWFLQRNGIPFSLLWFGYGAAPADMSSDTYNGLLNQASSVYFVNLVVMYVLHPLTATSLLVPLLTYILLQAMVRSNGHPYPTSEHLPTSTRL